MSSPLSSVAKYLTSIWKSESPKMGRTFSELKDSCQLATTQLVTTNLNQMISDRLHGCSLLKATLEETKDSKLSLLTGSGETIIFSDEKTMSQWLGDKQMVDIWQIKDLREGKSDTFYKLQRKNDWGYDTFETKEKLFDQLREDYGVFWKLEDQGEGQTSYIQYKTGLFNNRYVEVEHENLTFVANNLKLKGFDLSASTSRTQDGISWGQGIAACVLGGLLASAGKSLMQNSNPDPVSDAIASLGPTAFKAGFAFQMAALNGLDSFPGALLAGMMFLPESVKGQPLCPQWVGSYDTPDEARSVAISGNYAYMADYNSGLQIINVSNVANPVLVGVYDTPGKAYDVVVSDNYAYVADAYIANSSSGLQIIDVSNVTNPTLAGFYDTPDRARGVALSGNYAYVADGGSGLLIIDVNNVVFPTLAGSYNTPDFAQGVAVFGNYAYVVDLGGLQIIDVSNVANPTLAGSYDTPGYAVGVAVSGNYAYVADSESGLQIIDVSNIANPILGGFYNTSGWADDVAVSGNYAYVADGLSGLQIIDVSNVANPTLAGFYDTPSAARGIAVSNYAYMADYSAGLQIIDWNVPCSTPTSSGATSFSSDPLCPQLAGSYDTPGLAAGIAVSGNYAYVADYDRGLQIIDVSNVTNPTLAGSYDTLGYAYDIALSGNYAYVADDTAGLQIIDISNVANPTFAGSYNTLSYAWGVALSGNYAYVTDNESGLQIIDVSNVTNPTLAGFYNTPGWAYSVAISGNYAYVADYWRGLQIIDVNNVANPTLAGSYDTPGYAYGVAISGNYAYVAEYDRGLQIIDVSNVSNPTHASSYVTYDVAIGVAVSGNYAYVTSMSAGLQIIDVSDVVNPTLAASYNTPDLAVDVSVSGNYAYVADGYEGLQIINVSACPTSSSTTSSPSSFSTAKSSGSTSFSTAPLSSTSTTREKISSTVSDGFSFLWIGVLIGTGVVVCLGLTGGTAYILQRRRKSLDNSKSSDFESNSLQVSDEDDTSERLCKPEEDDFELMPVELTKRMQVRKLIGDKYFQMTVVDKKEAEDIYEQTGQSILITDPNDDVNFILGRGNFGSIKIGFRKDNGEYVASKKVKGEDNIRKSEDEANMQRNAAGENVLPIYNTIHLKKALYHFMPLAGYGSGGQIQNLLSGLNNPKHAIEIMHFVTKDILTGLKTIHTKGIYHLDMKPENVVFTKDGTGYITDFGCAKKAREKHAQIVYNALGDIRYFSPERLQACRERSTFDAEKTDIWSTGMLLLQMITNLPPLQLFEMSENFLARVQMCTQDYFLEKLNQFDELQKPKEGSLWWVIKGLLDPNAEIRFTAEEALQAPCFKRLEKATQASIFEDLKTEKPIQTAGKNRKKTDLRNHGLVSRMAMKIKAKDDIYDIQKHQQHYIKQDYQLTPGDLDSSLTPVNIDSQPALEGSYFE